VRRLATAFLIGAALALAPAAALADPALDGSFKPSGKPGHIARGPDGNVWFTMSGSPAGKEFGRIAPDGTITEYDTPNNLAAADLAGGPSTPGGPHDRIWLTQEGAVTRWDPAAATGTAHTIATLAGPRDIHAGPDGNMWAVAVDRVVKIGPDGTKLGDFLIGQVAGRGITRGSDDRMYLADFGNQAVQAFAVADPNNPQKIDTGVAPQEIEPGPAGQLALSLPNNEMARLTTAGALTKTTDPGTDPFGVAYGNDGAYWFAQFASNTLGRLTSDGQFSKPLTLPAGTGPRYIATGAGDTLWVSGETDGMIHRVSGVTAAPPPPPPPPPDTIAPVLTGAKVSVRKRRLTIGLSEDATLSVRIDVKRNGRRSGTTCKPLKKGRRTSKPCRYWKKVRTVGAIGVAGVNRVDLGKALKPGAYRTVAIATDAAGNASAAAVTGFKV
jgi:virginiamycin B lyase